MSILDTVKKTINRYHLLKKGDTVVIGVSGGPDSVALLNLLAALRKELSLTLYVAHLDHMLRPSSLADSRFVRDMARKLAVGFFTSRINVLRSAQKGSLEETARSFRHKFFMRVAKKVSADCVAVGHTADDQAETVLMRILRGSGLYGLAGIIPLRSINGLTFIRPLLEVRRKEIEAFLKKKKIGYRIDSTNKEDRYFRNRVRNRLLPYLEKEFTPQVKELLINLAESARYDYEYLVSRAPDFPKGRRAVILIKKLSRMHTSVKRLLLRNAYAAVKGDTRRLTLGHIKEIEDLIEARPVGSVVDLPKEVSAVKKAGKLIFYRRRIARNT